MHKSSLFAVCRKGGAKALFITIPCILGYLGISQSLIEILLFWMALDVLTGFGKSLLIPGKHIKSWIFDYGIFKKSIKLMLPIGIAYMGVAADLKLSYVSAVIMWMFILSEFYSVISNLYSMYIKKDMGEQEAFKIVLKWLLDVSMRIIKSIMNFIEGKLPGSKPEQ